MNEERMFILKMVAEGKITAEEADSLLRTLEEIDQPKRQSAPHPPTETPQEHMAELLKGGAEAFKQQAMRIKSEVLRNQEQFLREQKHVLKQTIGQAVRDVARTVSDISQTTEWSNLGSDRVRYEAPKQEQRVETGDQVALSLHHRHGDIEIDSWSEDAVRLEYQKIVWAEDEATAQRIASEIEVQVESGEPIEGRTPVRIKTVYPENWQLWQGRRKAKVNYWLKVPHETHLELKNRHGNVSVQNLRGAVEIENAHGNVDAQEIGGTTQINAQHSNLSVHTIGAELKLDAVHGHIDAGAIGGSVHLRGAHGNVSLSNVAGGVDVDRAHGNLEISDVRGDLTLNHRHGHAEAHQVNGVIWVDKRHGRIALKGVRDTFHIDSHHSGVDVEIVAPLTGDCVINALHSPVDITAPANAFASIQASTHHGNISSEFEGELAKGRHDCQFSAKPNETGANLQITNHHGSVHLRRRDAAAGEANEQEVEVEVEANPSGN
jgi:DUF4097 and DUF4098 domain-containing protein YvlB